MDLDDLLTHYFGTTEIDALYDEALAAGGERLRIDFAVERSPDRRFALWALMETLGEAPPPAEVFADDPDLRRAADAYLDAMWKATR